MIYIKVIQGYMMIDEHLLNIIDLDNDLVALIIPMINRLIIMINQNDKLTYIMIGEHLVNIIDLDNAE